MLSRLRRRDVGPPPDMKNVNFTREHVSVSKTIARRKRVLGLVWDKIPLMRFLLATIGVLWLFALPLERLWKGNYVDEHALQPAQVNTKFDWDNVHKADLYLGDLERSVNSTFEERTAYLQNTFSASGLDTANTTKSTWAHVKPPRSKGTESILVSSNWVSRDGTPNLRGVATLLAMSDFLRGQNHWAFDIILVVGEGYMEGLEDFMRNYHSLFTGVIWNGLNIDYPGHSFSHIGLFYEGINGRLPNQDVINAVQRTSHFSGGVPTRFHNIPDDVPDIGPEWFGKYLLGAKHLLHHFGYMITGRVSAGHGVLARHRIDSLTMYCTPATGPHGFHSLGKSVEATLRSFNNLLERLHASYFFYLLPRPWNFIPVGQYLPSAVLLGASLTIGGFDCPNPLQGLIYILPGFLVSLVAWISNLHPVMLMAIPVIQMQYFNPKDKIGNESGGENGRRNAHGDRRSAKSLILLLYGALIPTLAMLNFPQAIFLALLSIAYLTLPEIPGLVVLALTQPGLLLLVLRSQVWNDLDLQKDWVEFGNLTWPIGVYAIWIPLWINSVVLLQKQKSSASKI
ncbi:uncharacterized protein I303_104818 [Kwoniella dejecticola CBS 10117]|uniref:Glycosylphosphatidylinositol transamidase n=1 Tax=Kwoniella dejecticola CBS 10117 TaxID=1296121 RepID=A0A1A6A499_9TREE|nr:glycosylphosphatidylinositol transamidase [Kwoniella dejecticola CBS 10117]OBR84879.1 glycosylphosphatidylinositol transamidase [Kwoniella dejecticola CBS 10117]